ncbi:MAG: GTPase HflX [Kiritimatiellae bacterium]|nr:GTPase HflX [Kiritimatiellia bacterium]MDW8459515.1 GTPase HflX [Verrucomicrobiota bacterium]
MVRSISTFDTEVETALLVGVQHGTQPEWDVRDHLDELSLLCKTAGARVDARVICRVGRIHPATYIGRGKAEEIADRVRADQIATVVFDDDLSPAQGRNLESILGAKVIDRTQVILHIFAQHARTHEGRMQVELAQLEYLLPRLRRMWTHLERQRGGMGMHGPGEKQLELDRRRILERIDRFRTALQDVRRHRAEQRRGRRRHGWSVISLVGYTNAGKSSLLNALTGAGVLAEDKLFATLDPTTRRLALPNRRPALLTDTVGFIRKLPHGLVEAFKATLEEVAEADLLIHVVDCAHSRVDDQIRAVDAVLAEIGAADKPVLYALNKIDVPEGRAAAASLSSRLHPAVAISALTGEGLEDLRTAIGDALRESLVQAAVRIPLSEARLLAQIRAEALVIQEEFDAEHARIEAIFSPRLWEQCSKFHNPSPQGHLVR